MVYVDRLVKQSNGKSSYKLRCHMWADTPDELHKMADSIGLKRCWFQNKKGKNFPHYDLSPHKRQQALNEGAQEKSLRQHLKEKRTY